MDHALRVRRSLTDLQADHQAGRTKPLDDGLHAIAPSDTHRELQAKQDLARWTLILNQLPPQTLDIFMRNRVEGQTYVAIAAELDLPLWVLDDDLCGGGVWATVVPNQNGEEPSVIYRNNTIRLHVSIDDWPVVAASLRKLIENADAVYRRDRPEAEQVKDADYLRGFLTQAVQGG